jgi:tetratricopeptide (TPR) repeat protein
MKNLSLFFSITLVLAVTAPYLFAQTDSAKTLVEEGIKLHDAGKYAEAIDKYQAALKIAPTYTRAEYEMGFSLYVSGKAKEAIPVLENVIKSKDYLDEAYDLLGSIYDDNNEPDKAIAYFKQGIENNPKSEKLQFNLGISYLRQKKYAEAETCEVNAIKLDEKHASNQRIYAMAYTFEDKRVYALMAWCSFLLLEPQSQRSAQAFANIKSLLNDGIKQTGAKSVNISVSEKGLGGSNLSFQLAVLSATENNKKISSPIDTLNAQLTAVFTAATEYKESKEDTFFYNFYAKFFNQLATSDNMEAFTRLISLSAYKDDNLAWFKANKDKLDKLDMWIRSTPRSLGNE